MAGMAMASPAKMLRFLFRFHILVKKDE